MFGGKIVPHKMPHGMSGCLDPTLIYNPWTRFDETKRSYETKILEFEPTLNPIPNIKVTP